MSKERIFLEYPMKGSAARIWTYIGTAAGLSPWFADKVESFDRTYNFYWGKTEKKTAHLAAQRNGVYVRFRWDEEPHNTFFELRISFNELTREYTLEITDFADRNEIEDQKELWNSQIENLRRLSGM